MGEMVNISKTWKAVIGLCGTLAALAGGIEGYGTIKSKVQGSIDSYIHTQVKVELQNQKKNKETSYRYMRAKAFNISVDSLLLHDKAMFMSHLKMQAIFAEMLQVDLDRKAVKEYMKSLSLYIWRELALYEYKGAKFGYSESTDLTFYMREGFIFEAYHKGSSDSYWFKDSYGEEKECQ
jgi:hypothetical protein